jgi:hypothetical protein
VKKLLLLLLACSFVFAQEPVFKFRPGLTKYSDYWADTLDAYIWHSNITDSDSTITSPLIASGLGFDGLRQFFCRIDSFGVARHGDAITIRNFSDPRPASQYKETSVTVDTTAAYNIFFLYQTYLGETFGWQTNDTLEWSLYSDTTRADTSRFFTLSDDATLYTSVFKPTESDYMREHGIWQTDVPMPWRVLGYFNSVGNDTNTVLLKFEYINHTPNR